MPERRSILSRRSCILRRSGTRNKEVQDVKQDKQTPEQGGTRHIVEALNDTIEEARANVDMLTSLGADIQVVLHLSDRDEARNSIEVGPADRRVKIYYKDLDDLREQLEDARKGQTIAEDLGIVAPRGGSK
jgi:hypothetical protein